MTGRKGELYKGKYVIEVFDDDEDPPIIVADNHIDLANQLGTSEAFAKNKLAKLFSGEDKKLAVNGKYCTVHFVDMSE